MTKSTSLAESRPSLGSSAFVKSRYSLFSNDRVNLANHKSNFSKDEGLQNSCQFATVCQHKKLEVKNTIMCNLIQKMGPEEDLSSIIAMKMEKNNNCKCSFNSVSYSTSLEEKLKKTEEELLIYKNIVRQMCQKSKFYIHLDQARESVIYQPSEAYQRQQNK